MNIFTQSKNWGFRVKIFPGASHIKMGWLLNNVALEAVWKTSQSKGVYGHMHYVAVNWLEAKSKLKALKGGKFVKRLVLCSTMRRHSHIMEQWVHSKMHAYRHKFNSAIHKNS